MELSDYSTRIAAPLLMSCRLYCRHLFLALHRWVGLLTDLDTGKGENGGREKGRIHGAWIALIHS